MGGVTKLLSSTYSNGKESLNLSTKIHTYMYRARRKTEQLLSAYPDKAQLLLVPSLRPQNSGHLLEKAKVGPSYDGHLSEVPRSKHTA